MLFHCKYISLIFFFKNKYVLINIMTWSCKSDFYIKMLTRSVQFSSVTQSCPILCNPMNRSTPGLPVHHKLLEFTQTHVHWVGDAIQPSHPLSSPSPPAPNPSQNQGLFQWVNSSHEVAKVLEFQLQSSILIFTVALSILSSWFQDWKQPKKP